MKASCIAAAAFLAGATHAWMPQDRDLDAFNMTARYEKLGKRWKPDLPSGINKIRGVNFGGWLIGERWMMKDVWDNDIGCAGTGTEFDCMKNKYSGGNREEGNRRFENHWRDWINPDTVQSVHDVGLNTIRIPIGYWSYTDIVDKGSEPFADGDRMLPYLDAVVEKAAQLGIYVIIDLHGAPGGQQFDAFTGQNYNGFFNDYNFGRAAKWLSWMTRRIHTTNAYRTVGMIEAVNEPISQHDGDRWPAPGEDPGLVQKYYPMALKAVRDAENELGVSDDKRLHVQFMSDKWQSGNPRATSDVRNDVKVGFDDHNYASFGFPAGQRSNQYNLMHRVCTDNRVVDGESGFEITGEWSMTSDVDLQDTSFFKKWFAAQQQLYEVPGMSGWVYWTWKTQGLNGDPRWTYSSATAQGLVPTTAEGLERNVYQDVCSGFR